MKRILLVDDDDTVNFISKIILKNAGFEDVNVTINGKDACEYLEKYCPDIIFLDVNMPVMNGWEFLDEKEKGRFCKSVKVVMLTSSIRSKDKEKADCYECVKEYLEKPLNKEKLEMILEKFTD